MSLADQGLQAHGPGYEAMTSLESTTAIEDIQTLGNLLNVGIDTEAWLGKHPSKLFLSDSSVSYLSILTI